MVGYKWSVAATDIESCPKLHIPRRLALMDLSALLPLWILMIYIVLAGEGGKMIGHGVHVGSWKTYHIPTDCDCTKTQGCCVIYPLTNTIQARSRLSVVRDDIF
jgi:hypothetical protein